MVGLPKGNMLALYNNLNVPPRGRCFQARGPAPQATEAAATREARWHCCHVEAPDVCLLLASIDDVLGKETREDTSAARSLCQIALEGPEKELPIDK